MDAPDLIGSYRLLEHPFYRRWEAGELRAGELADYAAQYRHFEAQLPDFLTALCTIAGDESTRSLVCANLAEELGDPIAHVELFERFAVAVDAPDVEPSPAMRALIEVYAASLRQGNEAEALGVLAGYELQAAEVAASKGDGLAAHYDVDERGRSFWSHHAEVEVEHAAWTMEALSTKDPEAVRRGAKASAAAWWAFLDEREALVSV